MEEKNIEYLNYVGCCLYVEGCGYMKVKEQTLSDDVISLGGFSFYGEDGYFYYDKKGLWAFPMSYFESNENDTKDEHKSDAFSFKKISENEFMSKFEELKKNISYE